jgi:hypothetical protein
LDAASVTGIAGGVIGLIGDCASFARTIIATAIEVVDRPLG